MIVDFRIQWVNFLCGQVTHVRLRIRHAMQLIGIEVERANSLFPNDESEAVCELLRRSHENPDLKKGMLFMCALNVIREGREKRVWLKSFENCFLISFSSKN
jgi:hypothetical protein